MIGQNKERWRELCEQVEVEQDLPEEVERFLIEETNQLEDKSES